MRKKTDKLDMVAVVMPVFQGEDYLGPQIESILDQTYSNFNLYIRDDGSRDNSLEIIRSYASKDPRIIIRHHPGRLGITRSIKLLLENVREDLVFFADQDDFWMPRKIETMIKLFPGKAEEYRPVMVFSDLQVVDNNLNQISPSFWKVAGVDPGRIKFRQVISRNCVTGCASAINRAMLDLARKMPDKAVHDWWMACIAAHTGELISVPEPLVLYRQHGVNVIGAEHGGWPRMVVLVRDSYARKKYMSQLQQSIVHLKSFLNHPCFKGGLVQNFFLQKQIFRRRSFLFLLRFFQ
jgi:glycosyltransferase involved in cell wall biosynthesis